MAQVMICDRCGEIITSDSFTIGIRKFNIAHDPNVYESIIPNYNFSSHDLCANCMNKFNQFLRNEEIQRG